MKLVFNVKKAQADAVFDDGTDMVKAGPFIGPRGGKWADPQYKIPWREKKHGRGRKIEIPDLSSVDARVVKLPSEEEGGKPAHDVDFKTGFAAGKAAHAKNSEVSISHGERAFMRVHKKKHGAGWVEGFGAGVELSRPGGGAYNSRTARVARKMGLHKK